MSGRNIPNYPVSPLSNHRMRILSRISGKGWTTMFIEKATIAELKMAFEHREGRYVQERLDDRAFLHILDIVENSTRAGAKRVCIDISWKTEGKGSPLH